MEGMITTANNHIKRNGVDHMENMAFKRVINPGTQEDFKKEMKIFYPDMNGHFKGLVQ